MSESNEEAYWKDRYFKLINEDQKRQTERDEYESLLNRTVIRLTLAASGLDPALDPHLQAIRDVMRKQTPAILRQELDALLDTLVRVPKADSANPIQAPMLAPSIAAERETKGVLSKLFGGKNERAAAVVTGRVDERRLRERLGELLKAISFPDAMAGRVSQLHTQITDSGEDIVALFETASSLIIEASTENWKEQKQLCDFLAALSGKLGELEEKALGMDTLNESSAQNRRATEQAVAGQVADLRADASNATDLKQLREMISVRLDAIAAQLDSYKTTEEIRYAEARQQVKELSYRLQSLEQEADDLRNRLTLANKVAYVDPLTKLPNRNAYLERIDLEEKRWKRFRQPLSLVIWDIDHFKKINDRFGHASGDKALAVIGHLLGATLRNTDFVARYGGEEFVMLLVGADETEARDVAEDIRRKIENCEFTSEGRRIHITVSCGISQFKGRDLFGDCEIARDD